MVDATSGDTYLLRPVGRVASSLTDAASAPRQGDEGAPTAWLVFDPQVDRALRDLRVGAELLVLTWLDRARRDVLAVHPRGDESRPETGVFSTRSPHRPNPIGLHRVRVLAVTGCVSRWPTWRPSTAPRSWTSSRCWARPASARPRTRAQ